MSNAESGNHSPQNGYTPEELARDVSEPRREIGNATTCLWDIDQDELTDRESSRLRTILRKLDSLEDIIEAREVEEMKEEMA